MERGVITLREAGRESRLPRAYRAGMYMTIAIGAGHSKLVRVTAVDDLVPSPWVSVHYRRAEWFDRVWMWLRGIDPSASVWSAE